MKFIFTFTQSICVTLSWLTKPLRPIPTIILAFLLLLSCKQAQEQIEAITKKGAYKTLHYTPVHVEEIPLVGNSELLLQNSRLYCIDYGQEEQILTFEIQDTISRLIAKAAPLGKGPGEFGYVSGLKTYNQKCYFFDSRHQKVYWLKDSCCSLFADLSSFSETITEVCLLDTNHMLIAGLFENHRFILINKEGEIQSTYAEFPDKQHPGMPIHLKNMGFMNNFIIDGRAICNVVYDSGIIAFYESKNKTIKLIERKIYNQNRFEKQTIEGTTIVKHADSNTGFLDIQISQGLCYALYSETSWKENSDRAAFGHWLLVYNLEGKHLETYFLEEAISQFAIDDRRIIGMGSIKGVPMLLKYKI